jgi:hypothetical protein
LETYRPLLSAAFAVAPCILLDHSLPRGTLPDIFRLVASTLVFAAVYLLVLSRLAPADLRDLRDQLAPVWARFRRPRSAAPADVQ